MERNVTLTSDGNFTVAATLVTANVKVRVLNFIKITYRQSFSSPVKEMDVGLLIHPQPDQPQANP